MNYDLIVVGAGLFGSVVAHEAAAKGQHVLILDRRSHIGGNCYTENVDGINVHKYGAHIFRTSRKDIWDYIRQFAEFNHFVNSPIARHHGKVYNMPFNMNTFSRIWPDVTTPAEAKARIAEQRQEIVGEPKNLEEKAISLVGRDVYEILVREYTEKQWGRACKDLPASIIRRLPVRLTYDNNYFNDPYQGIPVGGYTPIIEKLLAHCEVRLGVDFKDIRNQVGGGKLEVEQRNRSSSSQPPQPSQPSQPHILYTGPIDEYFDYCFGPLEYRSLRFEHERHDETDNLQGVAVVNYTDSSVAYTRTIEHKHFEFGTQSFTIVSKEYPFEWKPGIEPYYPVNDAKNQSKYEQYQALAKSHPNVSFGGRLGTYRYTDMQDTIIAALNWATEFENLLWGQT